MSTIDPNEVRHLLVDAEQRAAEVPRLRLRLIELEQLLSEARNDADRARAHARELDEQLLTASQAMVDVFNSPSWRITEPLRRAKQRFQLTR